MGKRHQDVAAKLIEKAWKDETFYKLLLTNPKAAIEKELSIKIPEDIEIVVHQESSKTIHLVIPQKPAVEGDDSVKIPSGECRITCWYTGQARSITYCDA